MSSPAGTAACNPALPDDLAELELRIELLEDPDLRPYSWDLE